VPVRGAIGALADRAESTKKRCPMSKRAAVAAWSLLLACGVAACQPRPAQTGAGAQDATRVAVLDGMPISQGELDAWIKEDLFRSQTEDNAPAELYELRSSALQKMIDERILAAEAAKRGVSSEEVMRLEREALGAISDEQVKDFYEKNKQRIGGAPLEQVADRIRSFLDGQRDDDVMTELRKRTKLEVLLEPPRITVGAEGPSLGPAGAPVTIVEFSDFQCPYCARAGPIMKQVRERYPEQVRIVYRHLPLDRIHPLARGAAEASACADAQGRFWDFHDKLFENQRALGVEDLNRYAKELGLDAGEFEKCVTERRFQQTVERDLAAATEAATAAGKRGLGTPAFFINGIMLSGAKPAEEFFRVIDGELARGAAPPAAAGS
jgi:protein-disulfide isomerase